MKKLANKLVLSILTVVLTVIALGTTTFAWFTLTNTAAINQFSFNVQAGEGIEIKLGGLDSTNPWLSVISETAVLNYLVNLGFDGDFYLKPVTSGDGTSFHTFAPTDFNTGGDGYVLTPVDGGVIGDVISAGYVQFQLSFRSQQYSKINWTGVTLTSSAEPYINDVEFDGTGGFSFLIGDIFNTFASSATRISIKSASDDVVVYENPTLAPEQPDLEVREFNLNNTAIGAEPILFGAVNYYNAKNVDAGPYEQLTRPNDTLELDPVIPVNTIVVIDNDTNMRLILTLAEDGDYYTGVVTVRIWIEGWDPDAFNAILNSAIAIVLNFVGTDLITP